MSDQHAKPGDTIEIMGPCHHWKGKRIVVVERPENALGGGAIGEAWFVTESGHLQFFNTGYYKVISRCKNQVELKVDESGAHDTKEDGIMTSQPCNEVSFYVLRCPCGNKRGLGIPKRLGLNVGEVEEETGWLAVFLYDGGSVWLCPDCASKARDLSAQLIELVGGKTDIYIARLIQKSHQVRYQTEKKLDNPTL